MAKKLWGGRFRKKPDPLVEEFTRSIQFDYKLAQYDLLGSMAHVQILKKAGILTSDEASKLDKGLGWIYTSVKKGTFKPDLKNEDVHTQIQNILQKKIGDLALKLHTARSRNDQVVFATKMYCRTELSRVQMNIAELGSALHKIAGKNKNLIIPGFTHLQHAQPVYLRDYLGAYYEMLLRDKVRLGHIGDNLKITLGAGALAGTPLAATDYALKASQLVRGQGPGGSLSIEATQNSLDSVSDRDFVIEVLSALAIIGMHLSRLAEDLIIWSTKEFDLIEIDESFCTGSSLMPQKKNPDVLELVRGYAGRLYGNLVSVLVMMKGLPLTYNRDMQLDKEPLFSSIEIVSGELKALTGLIKTLTFNKEKIAEHLKDESLYATDLVYYLVKKKVPFKEAHDIVGKLVRHSQDHSVRIQDMPDLELKRFSDRFARKEVIRLFDPVVSVRSRHSIRRR